MICAVSNYSTKQETLFFMIFGLMMGVQGWGLFGWVADGFQSIRISIFIFWDGCFSAVPYTWISFWKFCDLSIVAEEGSSHPWGYLAGHCEGKEGQLPLHGTQDGRYSIAKLGTCYPLPTNTFCNFNLLRFVWFKDVLMTSAQLWLFSNRTLWQKLIHNHFSFARLKMYCWGNYPTHLY